MKSGGEILSNFKPQEGLESAVTRLLESAGLTEDGVKAKEDELLEGKDLSLEEVERRRAELRTQRELMFRAEARAKRVAKIKSKTFRKLARKRAERAGGGVEDLDEEMDEEDREKLERNRAIERATLRHGAKSGRWARDVGGDAGELEDRRRAKEEMLDIRDRLQRKIHGRGEGEEDDEESENENVDDAEDEESTKRRAFEQIEKLDKRDIDREGEDKGLMGMAFMKKAREREIRKAREVEQDLRRDIEMFGEESEEDDEKGKQDKVESMRIGGNEGRMVFSGPVPVSLHCMFGFHLTHI
jgi:U3 small nucleolar RNA-associated protein 14